MATMLHARRLAVVLVLMLAPPGCGARSELRVGTSAQNRPDAGPLGPALRVACAEAVLTRVGATAALRAAATASGGAPVTVRWVVAQRPDGATAEPSPADAPEATISFDRAGDWRFQFTASDAQGHEASCELRAYVTSPLSLVCPTDRVVVVGVPTDLVGVATSSAPGPIAALWSVTGRPPESLAQPASPDGLATTFRPDSVGDYVLRLAVRDSTRAEASCLVRVRATTDRTITCSAEVATRVGEAVTLRGTIEPMGSAPLRVEWTVLERPITSTAIPDAPSLATTAFMPDAVGVWTLRFTVSTDEREEIGACTTRVRATTDSALRVEVAWNVDRSCTRCNARGGGIDIDSHLGDNARTGGSFMNPALVCNTAACHCPQPRVCTGGVLEWPPLGPENDPILGYDPGISLPGPEVITIARTVVGTAFDVGASYHGHATMGVPLPPAEPTPVVARVFCAGALVYQSEAVTLTFRAPTLVAMGDTLWRVGQIQMTETGCTVTRCGTPATISECIAPLR